MKKLLVSLAVLLLPMGVVNAQIVSLDKNTSGVLSMKMEKNVLPKVNKSQTITNKIDVEADERLVGFYTSDELDLSGYSSLGIGHYTTQTIVEGELKAGSMFNADMLQRYVGGQFTKVRFGLSRSVGASKVSIMELDLDNGGVVSDPLSETEVPTTAAGWNDVTLSTPVTIEAGKNYLIAYDFYQESNTYPLLVDLNINPGGTAHYGVLAYGNLHDVYGLDWYEILDVGNLCIQAVVKGGNLADNDITLSDLTMDGSYFQSGGEVGFSFNISNAGKNVPSSYTLNIAVDGNVVSTLTTPVDLSGGEQNVYATATFTATSGAHELSVSVTDINGEVPTDYIFDDVVTASFNAYQESVPRQKTLVEQYTSVYCTYCPLGSALLSSLQSLRDDIALVCVHTSQMDRSNGADPYTIDGGDDIANNFATGGIPAATFNRYYVSDATLNSTGTMAIGLGYDDPDYAASVISENVIEQSNLIPSFAAVDIATGYNEETKQLDVTVSGHVSDDFYAYVGDNAVLTIYLTEDGLVYPQLNAGVWDEEYVHNNVLRAIVNRYTWGDALNFTDANTYSNTYSVVLDEEWNTENLHLVAFISRPMSIYSEYTDLWVNNANMVKVDLNASAGIGGVVTSGENATETARFTIDGTRISTPVKGINVVKMSDGTTRKVLVK